MADLGALALIAIGASPIAEWTKIAMKLGKDKIEVTSSDSGFDKEFLAAHREWSYTVDCNLKLSDTAGQKALLDSYLADGAAAVIEDLTITTKMGGIVFSGDVFVTDMPMTMDIKKEQTVSITFQGTGVMSAEADT